MARERFVTVTEAAELLGVHRHTVRSLWKRGLVKGERLGGRLLLERSAVEELAQTYSPKVGRPRTKRRRERSTDKGEER